MTISSSGGGSLVNARALHFEHYVQKRIDQTSWAPGPPPRELWQRTLRINGRQIKDIDALAVSGSIVLLVSCKSIPYTPEYERGDYGAVRNVRTHIEQSDVEWQERVNSLRQEPVGDNYNLEGCEIYGVVCTPFAVFAHRQQTRVILGSANSILRAVCSESELENFLNSRSSTGQSTV